MPVSKYNRMAEEHYLALLNAAREACARAHAHGGIVHYTDFAGVAKMSPESARKWLRALCKELGGEWKEGYCLCPPGA
jgi:hypothetical protein